MSQRLQASRVALCISKVKVPSVSESVTRSPIELFWTAKKTSILNGGVVVVSWPWQSSFASTQCHSLLRDQHHTGGIYSICSISNKRYCTYQKLKEIHMGQFLQDRKNYRFASFFFKVEPLCVQTRNLYGNTLTWPWNFFRVPYSNHVWVLLSHFWVKIRALRRALEKTQIS